MPRLAFTVLLGPWTCGDTVFSDSVEVDDAPADLVRFASHAHAAGVLDVTDGLDLSDVETQEASEAAAVELRGEWDGDRWEGGWHDGNVLQHDLAAAQAALAAVVTPGETEAAQQTLDEVEARIAAHMKGRK